MTTIAEGGRRILPGAPPPGEKPAGGAPSGGPVLGRRQRRIVTPEGVALTVELADRGSRAAAFILDLTFILVALVLGGIALALLSSLLQVWAQVAAILGFFLLRVFYFPFGELHWRGATPGKRILGLKVIDRAGGPLRPEAVVVRNLMREVEVFIPLTLVLMPSLTGFDNWAQLLVVIWIGIYTLMPLFNRDGLRVGDMVAGTMVIMAPKAALLPDLASQPARSSIPLTVRGGAADIVAANAQPGGAAPRYPFTPAQLGVYGIYELQTLEAVLRRNEPGSAAGRLEIARRIRAKIGWPGPNQAAFDAQSFDASAFLEAFYAAQRAHLERRLLYGHRRKDKHDKS